MRLFITGKQVRVSSALKSYTEKKIGKLDHYLPSLTDARVVFAKEKTKVESQTHLIQVTLRGNGAALRSEQRANDFSAAVDAVTEKLTKEIDRLKGKRSHNRDKGARESLLMQEPAVAGSPKIVRRKQFATPPMTEKQAIKAMNELGHSFFLFLNKSANTLNVLYRRNDGDYGLIQPTPED